MNKRGTQLLDTATRQISELTGLISTRGEAALRLPCPGREKLGDGTIASCALHTADNYHRIAGLLDGDGRHQRIAKFLHGHGEGKPHGDYRAENVDLQALLDRLSTGRAALSALADLTDEQLDTVPPASAIKFCDGQRTLEQIVTNMLNHQNHQLNAVKAAIA
jgi:hypothetical protein